MSQIVFDFSNERYVVTGASSGMGRQVALDLANAGATVLGIGRDDDRLQAMKAESPERIVAASLDVCDGEAMEAAIANFVAAHGKLKGGVHAAGITGVTPLKACEYNLAGKIMDVSFWAGMNLLQLITRSKYGEAGTSTVLFSSTAALSHARGMFAYSAAKAAVNAALGSAAREISAKGHRVNSVLPGWVTTPMTGHFSAAYSVDGGPSQYPLGLGQPEDVSGVVLFLLSDAARWITGSNIVVDGGALA
ncbi:MAG: SDR family oxidoreductase [Fretibacterium sp.]|nr:SDR family oxidoreductase [Fretibacterium sp.]